MIEITRKNLQKFLKDIDNLGKEVKRNTVREIAATSLDVQTEAKRTVPVITGRLKTSIGEQRRSSDGLGIIVDANVEYAVYVEYGTEFQKAQPFLNPAARKAKVKMLANLNFMLKSLGK